MKILLEALTEEPVEIINPVTGQTWRAAPEFTAAEAMSFRTVNKYDTEEAVNKMAALIARCMLPYHPDMTTEKVKEAFSYGQIMRILVSFLRLNGHLPSSITEGLTPKTTHSKKRKAPKR